jgi:broad specificity phosphatase PhoE
MVVVEGARLVLVRHAMPVVEPAVPAERWRLGPTGRAAARALQPLVTWPAYYVASSEPKAVQTLQEIAGQTNVITDAALVEVRRPHRWSDNSIYRAAARSYIQGACPEGWEPHDQVIGRFEEAVVRHAAAAADQGRTLVVDTHGVASTIWLASRYVLGPDPVEFWAALRFPDLIEIDLLHGLVQRLGD